LLKGLRNEICINSIKPYRICIWNDARFCLVRIINTSAILLGSSEENQGDTIFFDWFDDNNDSGFWSNDSFFDE